MTNAQIAVNGHSGITWWPYNDTPVPDGYLDLESILTHEFGHALGWEGHLSLADSVCGDVPVATDQTMCPGFQLAASYWRSTELHDRHTMDNAYP